MHKAPTWTQEAAARSADSGFAAMLDPGLDPGLDPVLDPVLDIVPVTEDPKHRIVLANDKLTVLDVLIEAGQSSLYHRHWRDQLVVSINTSDSTLHLPDGHTIDIATVHGAVNYLPTEEGVDVVHLVEAHDEVRVLDIEFSRRGPVGRPSVAVDPDQAEFAFPQGRLDRVSVAPGAAYLPRGSLLVAMEDGVLGAASGSWACAPGAVRWVEDTQGEPMRNLGESPLNLIEIALDY